MENIKNLHNNERYKEVSDLNTENVEERIGILLAKNVFDSEEEATTYLKNLDKSFYLFKVSDNEIKEFVDSFEIIVLDVEKQIKELETINTYIVDKSEKNEMFKNILMGMAKNFHDFRGQFIENEIKKNSTFSPIELVKNLGKFVRKNKVAFTAFTLFSLATRISVGEAEMDEISFEEIENEPTEDGDHKFSMENFKNHLLAQKENNDTIFIDSLSVDKSYDLQVIINDINDGEKVKLNFQEYTEYSQALLKEKKVLITPIEKKSSTKFSSNNEVEIKSYNAIGDTEEAAFLKALSIAAEFQETKISKKSIYGMQILAEDSLKIATNQEVTIVDFSVKKEELANGYFKYTANIKIEHPVSI